MKLNTENADFYKVAKTACFTNFAGYDIPLTLTNEISKAEAESRDGAYFLASYNSDGVLIIVEKYHNGHLFFRHQYFYFPDGKLKENHAIDKDGAEFIDRYDENGNRL